MLHGALGGEAARLVDERRGPGLELDVDHRHAPAPAVVIGSAECRRGERDDALAEQLGTDLLRVPREPEDQIASGVTY